MALKNFYSESINHNSKQGLFTIIEILSENFFIRDS